MSTPDFIYTIYIRTTPEKVWAAITNPEFRRQYWVDDISSDWKKGSEWQHKSHDQICTAGKVLESVPPTLLVITWVDPSLPDDGSRVTFEIKAFEDMVRLNVVHGDFKPGSIMAKRISEGWPRVLSSLKTLLESGRALNTWAGFEPSCGPRSYS